MLRLVILVVAGFWLALPPPVQSQPLTQITTHTSNDEAPVWTPDGQFIVFESDRTGTYQIYKIPVSGGSAQQLTLGPEENRWPQISPDGDLVVYSKRPDNTRRIWAVGINGGPEQQISTAPAGQNEDWSPFFSADGNTVYFSRRVAGNDWDIYTVPATGGTATFLLGGPAIEVPPVLSPLGDIIAFSSTSQGAYNVFEASLAAPGVWNQLTFETENTGVSDYSPDGSKFVYGSGKFHGPGTGDLLIYDRASGSSTRVTFDAEDGFNTGRNSGGRGSAFSPDGTRIAFNSNRVTGENNIWILDLSDPTNQPPTADAGADQTLVLGQTVSLDGSGSTDPDNNIDTYHWDFGDADEGSGPMVTHSYAQAGIYTATLTVTDLDGLFDSDDVIITVKSASEAALDLIEYLEASSIHAGIKNSLIMKLVNIVVRLDRSMMRAALNQLVAFINQVEDLRGEQLTHAEADFLVDAAQTIIGAINASPAEASRGIDRPEMGETLPNGDELPTVLRLNQNYPNPFRSSTLIRFALPAAEHVTLKVYDVRGREVTTLLDGWQESGPHQITFNADKLPRGVYFYRMKSGTYGMTRRLILSH